MFKLKLFNIQPNLLSVSKRAHMFTHDGNEIDVDIDEAVKLCNSVADNKTAYPDKRLEGQGYKFRDAVKIEYRGEEIQLYDENELEKYDFNSEKARIDRLVDAKELAEKKAKELTEANKLVKEKRIAEGLKLLEESESNETLDDEREPLSRMNKKELKELCEEYGLDTYGKNAELLERIEEYEAD